MSYRAYGEVLEFYSKKDVAEFDNEKLYTVFRALRNLCIVDKGIQTALCHDELFNYTLVIIDKMVKCNSESVHRPLIQALQFTFNLTVNNEDNVKLMIGSSELMKSWMILANEEKFKNLICGILYNLFLNSDSLPKVVLDVSFMNAVLESTLQETEFPIMFIENLFGKNDSEEFLPVLFKCDSKFHTILLNMLHDHVKDKDANINLVKCIKEDYKMRVSSALKFSSDRKGLEELFIFIKILSTCASKISAQSVLLTDVEVLDLTKDLLQLIHFKGKQSNSSMFTPTQEIFPEQTGVENLKANLIRLIANLCHRNKLMQDRIRETEGLPLILDCSGRDGKNPFITESVIFAIRNLCEGNTDNQDVIRSINSDEYEQIVTGEHKRVSLLMQD